MKRVIRILLAIVIVSALMLTIAACDQDPCKDGHSWDGGSITKQPTCQAEGTILKRCMKCGAVEQQTLAKVGHDWGEPNVIVPPTCSTPGRASVKCKNCDETQPDEIIPATGNHVVNLQAKHEAVEATCWREGSIEYYDCQTCGSTVKLDADGNVLTDVKVAKTAHNYDNGVITKAPTCTDTGIKTFTCQNEGCTGDGHTFEQVLDKVDHVYGRLNKRVEPTCDTSGVSAYYQCEVCHKYFDESKQETEWTNLVIAALGHNYEKVDGKPATCTQDGFETYYKCNRCHGIFSREGEDTYYPLTNPVPIRAKGHEEKQIPAIEATCTKGGKTAGVECAVCGVILVTPKNTAPLGHQWGEWYEVQHPTCTEQGVMHRDCLRMCGATDEQTKSIPALGHNYVYTSDNDSVHHTVTCSRDCGYKAVEECASTGAWMSDNADYHYRKCDKCKGECDIANHTFQNKQCTVCGAEQSEVIVRVAGELDHTENSVTAAIEYIKQNYNDGKTPVAIVIGATRSANADVTFDGKIKVTLDLGNFGINMRTFSLIVDEQADVTLVNGTLTGKVQFNGGKLVLSGVSGDYTIALKAGLQCDEADVTVNGTRLDHAWNNGQVTTPPTCEGTGTRTFTCTRCQATRTEDEPAKGHTYGALIPQQDPTCTATGTAAHYQCSDCRKLFIDENGSKKEVQADELVLQKLPHAYGTIHPMEEATCVTDGHKAYYQCESCKQYFDEYKQPAEWKDLVLTSGGHDYDTKNWQSNETSHWYACKNDPTHHDQEATHSWDYRKDTNGSHEHYCTVCGYIDKVDTTCSPAKPAPAESHDSTHGLNIQDGWYADADNHWQICEKCGETINKGAHDWVGEEGNKTCKDCGHKFFDVKISDGDGLDQSAPTIAAAFAWIKSNGDNSKTYTVTLTHNRSDDSADAVTVPDGYTVVLVLGDYSVTYPNGKLSIDNGSTLTVTSGKGVLNIGTIEYNGGTLVLPAGEYNFKINGTTCDKADITVGEQHLDHQYPDSWVKKNDSYHMHNCEFCGHEESELHTWDSAWKYDDGNLTHTHSCKCIDEQTEENLTETKECESEVKVVDGVSKNVCKTCGKELPTDDIIAKLNSLYQDEDVTSSTYLEGEYILTGIITRVDGTNVYIDVSGDTQKLNLECYKFDLNGNKATDLIVGAKLTVQGTLMCFVNYYTDAKTLEFQEGCKLIEIDKKVSYKVSYESELDLVDAYGNDLLSEYLVGEVVTFKVKESAKRVVNTVTINDEPVEPDENGLYSFEIHGDVTIVVTAADWGEETTKRVARLSFESDVTTNDPSISSYENSYNFTRDGVTWTAHSFSNNQKDWNYIATGHKTKENAQLGTITTTQPIPFKITKLEVGILFPKYTQDYNNHNYVTSFKLIIAGGVTLSSGKVTAITDVKKEITQTIQDPGNETKIIKYTFEIPEEYQSGYYFSLQIATKLVTSSGSNGFVAVKYIDYYGLVVPECTHPEEFRTEVEAKAATCTKDGNKAYSICERCGQLFDERGEKTTIENVTEKALGHDYPDEWTNNKNGTHSKTCQRTDCDGGDKQTITENCSEHYTWKNDGSIKGQHWQECTECGYTTEPTGHNWKSVDGKQVCEQCEMEYCEHKNLTPHLEEKPDCTKDGHITYYQCDTCGQRFASNVPDNLGNPLTDDQIVDQAHKQLGHVWQYVRELNDGKSVEFGKHIQECQRCHGTQNDGVCTIDSANTCSTCGHLYTTEEIFAALEELDGTGTLVSDSTEFTLQGTLGGSTGNWTLTVDVSGGQKQLALPSVSFDSFDAVVGSVITVRGALRKSSDNLQVYQGTVTECAYPKFAVNHNVTAEYGEITFEPTLDEGKLTYGTEAKFTVQAYNPWKVKEVTVNGSKVEAESGSYKFSVKGEVTINVEFVNRYTATEELYAHLSFGADVNSNDDNVQSYDEAHEYTRKVNGGDVTWILENFNTNNKQWTNVRCGRGSASAGKITNKTPFTEKITRVVVNLYYAKAMSDNDNVNSFTLTIVKKITVSSSGSVSYVDTDKVGAVTVELQKHKDTSTGVDYEFAIPKEYQNTDNSNYYYILTIDCKAKSNGFIAVNSVDYYAMQGEVCNHPQDQVKSVGADRPCQEDGHQAYWYCEQCHRYYREAELQNEFDPFDASEKIAHHGIKHEQPATCTQAGYTYWQCEYCKGCAAEENDHDYSSTVEEAETFNSVPALEHRKDGELQIKQCSELDPDKQSEHNHYCALCGEIINSVTGAELEGHWSATGDDLDGAGHAIPCTLCGYKKIEAKHNTDGDNGSCTVCGHGAKPFAVGEQYVDTLQEAIEALGETGGTIKLNMNYSTEGESPAEDEFDIMLGSGNVEIDTGSFTLTLKSNLGVMILDGTFTVKGNVVVEQTKTLYVSATTISVQANITGEMGFEGATTVSADFILKGDVSLTDGSLTLKSGSSVQGNVIVEDGTFTVESAKSGEESSVQVTGKLTVAKGNVTVSGTVQTVEVNGGTFTLESGATIKGNLNITAGTATINGSVYAAEISGTSDVTIDATGASMTLSTSLVINGSGLVTIKGNINGNIECNNNKNVTISDGTVTGTVTVNGGQNVYIQSIVTGTITVKGGEVYLEGATVNDVEMITEGNTVGLNVDTSTTINGTVTINAESGNPSNVSANFDNPQTNYDISIEGGVTCDMLSIYFNRTKISHSYVDQNDGNHKCDICAKSEAHNWKVVVLTEGWREDTHDLICENCNATKTEAHKSSGTCDCGYVNAAAVWTLANDKTVFGVGDRIILVNKNSKYINSSTFSQNKLKSTTDFTIPQSGTFTDDDLVGTSVAPILLGQGSANDSFTLKVGTEFIGHSSSTNFLHSTTVSNLAQYSWTIKVTSTGEGTILNQGGSKDRYIACYEKASDFRPYNNGSNPKPLIYWIPA